MATTTSSSPAVTTNSGADFVTLLGRILMALLFVPAGWGKLTAFAGTVGYFGKIGVPAPEVATVVAILVELGVGLLFLVGFKTRWMAVILAVFTVGTAFLAHHFWNMTGEQVMPNQINFFKNMAITGGFLAYAVFGPGRLSFDKR